MTYLVNDWHGVEGKIKYLSENPGKGD